MLTLQASVLAKITAQQCYIDYSDTVSYNQLTELLPDYLHNVQQDDTDRLTNAIYSEYRKLLDDGPPPHADKVWL